MLKEEHFGYGYRELTNQYIDGAPASSSRLDWRYRYNAQGEREQKRLYYGPDGDEYEHAYPWVYYALGGAKEQLAVYHGQQMLGGPALRLRGRCCCIRWSTSLPVWGTQERVRQ